MAGPEGLVPLASGREPEAMLEGSGAAVRVAAVSGAWAAKAAAGPGPQGGKALCAIALEGWGAAFIETGTEGHSLHIAQRRIDAMAGLDVGGLWAAGTDGAWILSTFRNPFADSDESAGMQEGGVQLVSAEGASAIDVPPPTGLGPAYELFAFLPDPRQAGAWLAQFRDSIGSKVRSVWASYPALGRGAAAGATAGGMEATQGASAFKVISRSAFESALSPRPLALAPASLVAAIEGLGPAKGESALLRLDEASGESMWFRWGSDSASPRELHAWADAEGDILVLSPEGAASLFLAGLPSSQHQANPRSFVLPGLPRGANCSGCALLDAGVGGVTGGRTGLWLVASWESSEASGILVGPALH
ncbi:MAG: hypothetical protein M0001_12150 [Treponema sp.]|nr:hypothetical protein [Treponema sp.]